MHVFYWDLLQDIQTVQSLISKNQVVAGQTDTVIGLFGNCTKEAFLALNRIKKRSKKPYIILINSIAKTEMFIHPEIYQDFLLLASFFWPGPYTLISRVHTPFLFAASTQQEIALRMPDCPEIIGFLSPFAGVFSTSANIAGQAIPKSMEALDPEIAKEIAGFIAFKNTRKQAAPSTIIRLHENKQISVLRGSLSELQTATLIRYGFILSSTL